MGRLGGGVTNAGVDGEVAGVAGGVSTPPNSPHAPILPSEAHVDQHVPGPKMKSQAIGFGTAKRAPIARSRGELRVEYRNLFSRQRTREYRNDNCLYSRSLIRAKQGPKPGISKKWLFKSSLLLFKMYKVHIEV